MDIIVTFPGGKKVDAGYKGFTIHTDQPEHAGGDGSAPSPFDLFLASIGTCSAVYVLYFCNKRGIPLEDIRLIQRMERNEETKMTTKITLDIEVPEDFPEKYKEALINTVDRCTVKRHILNPPEFALRVVTAG